MKNNNKKIVQLDNLRTALIRENNLKAIKKTYSKKFDILNLNSGKLWDKTFKNEGSLHSQSPMTKDKIQIIANLINQSPGKILDLGLGQGFLEELLTSTNHQIDGIDISNYAINRAKKLFKGNFLVGDVIKIDKYFKNKSYEYVVALELLEHISVSKLFSFYRKINKLLQKEGILIISIPVNEHLEKMENNPSAHIRNYNYDIIKTELNINGFIVEKRYFLYAFKNFYKIKKFLTKIFVNRWEPNCIIIIAKKKNIR